MTKEAGMEGKKGYQCAWGGQANRCHADRLEFGVYCPAHQAHCDKAHAEREAKRAADLAAAPKAGETWILADCGCVGTLAGSQNPKGMWRLTYMVPCAYGQDAFHYALDPNLKGAARVTVTTVTAGPAITLTGTSHQAGTMAVTEASGKAMVANVEAQERSGLLRWLPINLSPEEKARAQAYQRQIDECIAQMRTATSFMINPKWLASDPAKEPSKAVVTVYRPNPPAPPPPRYEVSEDGKHWVPYATLTDAGPMEAFKWRRLVGWKYPDRSSPGADEKQRNVRILEHITKDIQTGTRMEREGKATRQRPPTPEPRRPRVDDWDLLEDV